MITVSDARIVALATAWETTPELVLRELHATQATAHERGYDYRAEDLLNAATAVNDMVDAVSSALSD
jgi:hypothetical protein